MISGLLSVLLRQEAPSEVSPSKLDPNRPTVLWAQI